MHTYNLLIITFVSLFQYVSKSTNNDFCTQRGSQISGSSLYSIGDCFMHNAKITNFDEVSKVKMV